MLEINVRKGVFKDNPGLSSSGKNAEREIDLDDVTLREHDSVPAGWVIFPVGVRAVFTARKPRLLGLLPLQYGGLLEAT